MAYKNIPTKPELFRDLQIIKTDAEKELGTKFDWNSFILGLLGGAVGTGLGVAIAKAVRRYQEEKKKEGGKQ